MQLGLKRFPKPNFSNGIGSLEKRGQIFTMEGLYLEVLYVITVDCMWELDRASATAPTENGSLQVPAK